MNKFCLFYLGVILAALIGVGSMDFEDQLKQQDLYCEMVSSGAWGDYNENYQEICPADPGDIPAQEEGTTDKQSYISSAAFHGYPVSRGLGGRLSF